jgi:hypothetical protein
MSHPDAAPSAPTGHSRIILTMALVFIAMVAVAVSTIEIAPDKVPVHRNASPQGYTWSLSLSLLPLAVLLGWFFRVRDEHRMEWRAFGYTAAIVFVLWTTLDILLANSIFLFPNEAATLPVRIPGLHCCPLEWKLDIPIEELIFYLSTVLVMVLLYIWSSTAWFSPVSEEEYERKGRAMKRAIQLDGWRVKVAYAAGLFLAVLAYKKLGWHDNTDGFPLYAGFLILGVLAPTLVFWQAVKDVVNQRALLFTMMTVLLISLLWEVTLGMAYEWWGYQEHMMMGIFIRPWFDLPVEAVFLWMVAGWSNVTLYELLKLRAASGRRMDQFLTGRELPLPRLRRRRGGAAQDDGA